MICLFLNTRTNLSFKYFFIATPNVYFNLMILIHLTAENICKLIVESKMGNED